MHAIKYVARRTGLTAHTIRAWERRHAALSPQRTATNRRLYSDADVERLILLRRAVEAGHSIGQIAGLSSAELHALTAPHQAEPPEVGEPPEMDPRLAECLRAVERLDAEGLEAVLTRAVTALGAVAFTEQVVLPLVDRIGHGWREGAVRTAHEHLGTAVLRTFLGQMTSAFQSPAHAPRLVVTTPAGQLHELGALIAAMVAASEGWRVTYLGPNLPAEEIAGAVQQSGARAVALSIVYPPDDPRLPQELTALRKHLGPEIAILAGGRAATAYLRTLSAIGAVVLHDMRGLRAELEAMRA